MKTITFTMTTKVSLSRLLFALQSFLFYFYAAQKTLTGNYHSDACYQYDYPYHYEKMLNLIKCSNSAVFIVYNVFLNLQSHSSSSCSIGCWCERNS